MILRKNTVFTIYLTLLVAVYSAFSCWVLLRTRHEVRTALRRCDEVSAYSDKVRVACSNLVLAVESISTERLGSEGGLHLEERGGSDAPGSPGAPEPLAPVEEPECIGVGQNGLYAYADMRFPDGRVERYYRRLPPHLRRGSRK